MSDDYEDLIECALSDELEGKLFDAARECTFSWVNVVGELFGVVMVYLFKDGKIWMIVVECCKCIMVICCNSRASVCVMFIGMVFGGGKMVSYKGICVVYDDREIKDWFYLEFVLWICFDLVVVVVF